ncbi:Ankyrin repeat, SAM and basic leucine zipper domain-containing protein 1 [Eumeta japonica]|uniref:Ankyrin repeat, SAM and basic leucine zipper domain-containing protein 1 n=1 Tax=Eumeta variegata TaxID=151549 RepID=A0A4C1YXA8_EUMVA|nr:Ankyrin repeat, SAM and basic leucine zipper domain-containing protein 1 [Eumeta japonica]
MRQKWHYKNWMESSECTEAEMNDFLLKQLLVLCLLRLFNNGVGTIFYDTHTKLAVFESESITDLDNNVNAKLDSGWTPLIHSCFHAQDNIVEYLLNRGADPNLHADSVTPIMAACSNSTANDDAVTNIVNYLIHKESLLNIGDKYGQTPLMRAIGSGRVQIVKKLLDNKVNIEMRDQQGWTALFWAVHHNQQDILNMLIDHGGRLTEIDKFGRTLMEIAESHGYDNIIDILRNKMKMDDDTDEMTTKFYTNNLDRSWHDYYPGLGKSERPNYSCEIPHLLYGMGCERLGPLIDSSGIDFRTFLLMEEDDMIKLGIDLPYERQRLKYGLYKFHTKNWKLSAVAGLYARQQQNYSVLDCLTNLGTHLQQIYILEATLQYVLRNYNKIQEQIKSKPPDSLTNDKLKGAVKKIVININSIRRETKILKQLLTKISRNNPPPADFIAEKPTFKEKAFNYMTKFGLGLTVALITYQTKIYLCRVLNK